MDEEEFNVLLNKIQILISNEKTYLSLLNNMKRKLKYEIKKVNKIKMEGDS